jgi:hypothetical protein
MALSLVMSNDKSHHSVTYRITFPDPISLGIRSKLDPGIVGVTRRSFYFVRLIAR